MSPENAWARYRTEFRAYSLANYQGVTDAPGSAAAPWDNARQLRIHNHLYGGYRWHKPNYDDNTDVYGERYQDLIHGYTHAESMNLRNSPRIDELYDRLRACNPSHTDSTASPLSELVAAANALTAADRVDVNDARALDLQELMKTKLEPGVFAQVATICNGGALPAWANVNIGAARRAIQAAGSGAGTDEEAIYQAIRNASAPERAAMKTDMAIQRVLRTEMSGHDLWRAYFLIEFGTESQWPATITELWEATEGGGTDEARIRRALEALTNPQAQAIAQIPGMRDMMNDELSGQDLATVNALLAGQYADRIAAHQQDMQAVSALVTAGLTDPDATWQARCTKLNDPAKAQIHAMTSTHDAAQRAQEAGQQGKEAHFGANTSHPATNDRYASEPSSTAGIRFVAAGTTQETAGVNLYVYGAGGMAQAALKTLLETFADTLP